MTPPLRKSLWSCAAKILGGLGAGIILHQYLGSNYNLGAMVLATVAFTFMTYSEYKKESV